MTVKCLTDIQKDVISDLYFYGGITMQQLAKSYKVSRRTIGRVIQENIMEHQYQQQQTVTQPTLATKPGFPMYSTQTVFDFGAVDQHNLLHKVFEVLRKPFNVQSNK